MFNYWLVFAFLGAGAACAAHTLVVSRLSAQRERTRLARLSLTNRPAYELELLEAQRAFLTQQVHRAARDCRELTARWPQVYAATPTTYQME